MISKDEMAIAILGTHEIDTSLQFFHANIPCRDAAGRPGILASTICQLGERKIKTTQSQPVVEQQCTTVALTVWKEDWSPEDLKIATNQTFQFFCKRFKTQQMGDIIEACWGQSMRHDRKPADALQASSVQIHCTVQTSKLQTLLQASGFNRIFATPKTEDGKISQEWRIIWIEGNIAHLSGIANRHPACLGLCRSQKPFGFRFARQHFQAAWTDICPNKDPPEDFQVQFLYRVEALPYGCTATMLQNWAKRINWPFKAIKAIGPRGWLVGAKEKAPEKLFTFNTSPVIVGPVQNKMSQETSSIIAGPRPSKHAAPLSRENDHMSPFHDPWAGWKGSSANTTVGNALNQRDVSGPTEAKFKEQEVRITAMEQNLNQLQQNTEAGFKKVELRDKQNQAHMHEAIHTVKHEIESSFAAAINMQSQQLNQTLSDLKSLLQAHPKRPREREDENMDEP